MGRREFLKITGEYFLLFENGHIVFYTRSKIPGGNIGTFFASENRELRIN